MPCNYIELVSNYWEQVVLLLFVTVTIIIWGDPNDRQLLICSNACSSEMITIRFAGWISSRIVSLQLDTDIQKLLSNGKRIRIRISETLLLIFQGFRLLEKVAHCTIIHLLSSEESFQPSVP